MGKNLLGEVPTVKIPDAVPYIQSMLIRYCVIGTCLTCGCTFNKARSSRKYCCKECQSKGQIKLRRNAICRMCGNSFIVSRECKGVYCSRECQHNSMKLDLKSDDIKKLENDYKRQIEDMIRWIKRVGYVIQSKKHSIKLCVICGKQFISKSCNNLCCSSKCSKRYYNRNHDKRIYRNGKPDLSITLTKLYMRDGGICYLCGRSIDFDCNYNSNDYPSIDHVIPLSKGGLHEWNNVQLACRGCNQRKGDSL